MQFKIMNRIYPTNDFLKQRFKMDVGKLYTAKRDVLKMTQRVEF